MNSKYDLKPSKVFSSIRKRLKSIANRMRRLQMCFQSSEKAKIRWQIECEGFKSVFNHSKTLKIDIKLVCECFKNVFFYPKMLKMNSKYDLKPSKVFSPLRKRIKSIANSMQRLQKRFRSSENAINQRKIPSENFKTVFVHPKTL